MAEPARATGKIVLIAESRPIPAGQIATLADLKKTLRLQKMDWNRPDSLRSLSDRQISVEIVKRSF